MGENINFVAPTCSNAISPDVTAASQKTEEPRICPLCSSVVRFFFIHFNDKLLMCENTKCEFPFGYEDLQFISVDDVEEFEAFTNKTKCQLLTDSVGVNISKLQLSEIDTINRESKATQDKYNKIFEKQKKLKKNIKEMDGNLKESDEIHKEIKESSKPKTTLKNRKHIKNLAYFQGVSVNLLSKPKEMDQLKTVKTDFGVEKGETKLNIELGTYNTISSINLDIADKIK